MYSNLLNIKSCYNFLESTVKIEDYISFAKVNNFSAVFYSDTNYMYGAAEFVKTANKYNLKSIVGVEFKFENFNIIFYAKNNEGYKLISNLSSKLQLEFTKDHLKFQEYLIKQNLDNVVSVLIPKGDVKNILDILKEENLFIGVNSENYNLCQSSFPKHKMVFANEVSSLQENEYSNLRILKAIKDGNSLENITDLNNNFFIKEINLAKYINIDFHKKNIQHIIELCNFNMFEENQKHYLTYKNKKNISSKEYILEVCEYELKNYLNLNNSLDKELYNERLKYELDVISQMGFEDYFLVVSDMIAEANKRNILVGPGRGSASGSLVSYLLKITKVDPIKYDLLFERFLNIDRVTMPDIDIDFQDDRRDEIIEYLSEKYGEQHFATITTFQTIGIKNAIRDCARVMNISQDTADRIAKSVPNGITVNLIEALEKSSELKKYLEEMPQLYSAIKAIIGLPRQIGTHAAGVVFCDNNLEDILPVKKGSNNVTQTQYPMEYLEELGLIKTDILGLRNLSIIQDVIKTIQKTTNNLISLDEIPLDDSKTYANLKSGDTVGIFQLESVGMTDVLMKMDPKSIVDIANTSSLYRPGPQENIPLFIKRKNKEESEFIIDETLEDILSSTFGIIVYQEQVMKIIQRVAGMSLSQADIIRRAMGKKDIELMTKFKDEFISGASNNNYNKPKAEQIWNYIEKFASYGFNKSHAITYSIIGYWMSYLKTHYRGEFYCALLNGVIRNEEKTNLYIHEAKKHNIGIVAPSITNPNKKYTCNQNNIFMPLSIIKGIGPDFLNLLQEIYKSKREVFENLFELLGQIPSKNLSEQTFNALVYAGALDQFGYSRKQLISYKGEILDIVLLKTNGMTFGVDLLLDQESNNNEELLSYEKEYLGFYVSAHPILLIKNKMNNKHLVGIAAIRNEDEIYSVLVQIDNITTKVDKNNNEMAFLDVSDDTSSISVTIFASAFEKIKSTLSIGDIVHIKIKSQIYNSKMSGLFMDYVQKVK